jgi:hypothetical protein
MQRAQILSSKTTSHQRSCDDQQRESAIDIALTRGLVKRNHETIADAAFRS